MNVFITGASGFIGLGLTRALVRRNFSVTAATRSESNDLHSCVRQVSFGDFLPDTNWLVAIKDIDIVVHLAARAHVINDKAHDPLEQYRKTNVEVTLNLARQAAFSGVSRFIFISSIGVNGNQTSSAPFKADDIPNPTLPYSVSKYEAELGLRQISADTGMEVVVIRPPLVYGANAPGNFGRLLESLVRGSLLPLGAIYNQRSFVALDNLVDFVITCILHNDAANHTFLVSDGEDISTTELLKRLGVALGKPANLVPIPHSLIHGGLIILGKKAIATSLCGSLKIDIKKNRDLLGWVPAISLEDALNNTAKNYLATNQHGIL